MPHFPEQDRVLRKEESLKVEKAQVEAEKKNARERTAADIVAGVNPGVYRKYENICKHRRGLAVAEALGGRCRACHMATRLQFFQDLKKGDQIMTCESCGRILYYNPPVAVEDLAGEPVRAIEQ